LRIEQLRNAVVKVEGFKTAHCRPRPYPDGRDLAGLDPSLFFEKALPE
jgi:hypothetical protein